MFFEVLKWVSWLSFEFNCLTQHIFVPCQFVPASNYGRHLRRLLRTTIGDSSAFEKACVAMVRSQDVKVNQLARWWPKYISVKVQFESIEQSTVILNFCCYHPGKCFQRWSNVLKTPTFADVGQQLPPI